MATKKRSSSSGSSSTTQGLLPWLGIATIVLLLDQLSKITILKLFHYGQSLPITAAGKALNMNHQGLQFFAGRCVP